MVRIPPGASTVHIQVSDADHVSILHFVVQYRHTKHRWNGGGEHVRELKTSIIPDSKLTIAQCRQILAQSEAHNVDLSSIKTRDLVESVPISGDFVHVGTHPLFDVVELVCGTLELVRVKETHGVVVHGVKKEVWNKYVSKDEVVRAVEMLLAVAQVDAGKETLRLRCDHNRKGSHATITFG